MVLRVRLVPDDFAVPEVVEAGSFTLRKLTVRDVVADFAPSCRAWIISRASLVITSHGRAA
jgi:hypothetical protein